MKIRRNVELQNKINLNKAQQTKQLEGETKINYTTRPLKHGCS